MSISINFNIKKYFTMLVFKSKIIILNVLYLCFRPAIFVARKKIESVTYKLIDLAVFRNLKKI